MHVFPESNSEKFFGAEMPKWDSQTLTYRGQVGNLAATRRPIEPPVARVVPVCVGDPVEVVSDRCA